MGLSMDSSAALIGITTIAYLKSVHVSPINTNYMGLSMDSSYSADWDNNNSLFKVCPCFSDQHQLHGFVDGFKLQR